MITLTAGRAVRRRNTVVRVAYVYVLAVPPIVGLILLSPFQWVAVLVTLSAALTTVLLLMGQPGGALTVLCLANAAQPVVQTIDPTSIALLLDDISLLILALAAAIVLIRRRGTLAAMAGLGGLLLIAAMRAPTLGLGLFQARQIAVPIALVGIGIAYSACVMKQLPRIVLITGCALFVYMSMEATGRFVVDPARAHGILAYQSDFTYRGLPGSYYYFVNGVTPIRRLGGYFLSPPACGLYAALVAVVAYHTLKGAPKLIVTLTAFVAVASTLSRGGMLLALIGCLLPGMVRRLRSLPALICVSIVGAVVAPHVINDGASSRHTEGLFTGVTTALKHPIGIGFGYTGNAAKYTANASTGESLVGMLLSATGLIGVAAVAYMVYRAIRMLNAGDWRGGLLFGMVFAAALSETASSLDGTGACWAICGSAFTLAQTPAAAALRRRYVRFCS